MKLGRPGSIGYLLTFIVLGLAVLLMWNNQTLAEDSTYPELPIESPPPPDPDNDSIPPDSTTNFVVEDDNSQNALMTTVIDIIEGK